MSAIEWFAYGLMGLTLLVVPVATYFDHPEWHDLRGKLIAIVATLAIGALEGAMIYGTVSA